MCVLTLNEPPSLLAARWHEVGAAAPAAQLKEVAPRTCQRRAGHAESSIGARRSSKGGWSKCEFTLSICGLRLPSSDAHIPLIPPLELAAAIGCLIRLLDLLSKYLSFPLLHVAAFAASSSKVWHRQSYWSLTPPTNPRDGISFSLTPSHSHAPFPSSLDSSSHSPSSPPFSSNLPSSPSASTHSSASTLPGSFLSSSFACNSLFGSWAGIPPSPLQDEAGNPINFSHASAANQQLPPGEIKQVRRGLRLLRRSAACLAAAHAGRFGIAKPGDEARGGGGAELDDFAELAMMMSAATRDTRLPFLRNQGCDSSLFFCPPTTTQPPHLKPHHPALPPFAAATSPTAAAEGGAGEGVQVPHENLLGNSLVEDYISTTAAALPQGLKSPCRVIPIEARAQVPAFSPLDLSLLPLPPSPLFQAARSQNTL
ncbi:unnamed protein product [Closterium sp. Naga37s-1]|nr:unnamed protein product [Closterium sp. Naga37s-1]